MRAQGPVQAAAVHPGQADVEVVGQARLQGPIEQHAGEALLQALPQLIAQVLKMAVALLLFLQRKAGGGGKAHDQGGGQGAGPEPGFLAAPPLQRFDGDALPQHQGADALGPVELVGTEAEQVNPQGIRVQRQRPEGLGSVAVQGDAMAAANRSQLLERLEHADFVVGRHHAHQPRFGGDRRLQLLGADQSIGAWGQQGDAEAFPLQLLERIEHGVVFGGHADQMAAPQGAGMAQQRQVVGFRGTAGEHQPFRLHLQRFRQLAPRHVHRGRGAEAEPMLAAGGIAPVRTPERRHRLHHLSRTGGGGLEIKGESRAAQDDAGRCCDHGAALRTALAWVCDCQWLCWAWAGWCACNPPVASTVSRCWSRCGNRGQPISRC